MRQKISWSKIHKWVGLPATVFILIFCLSGIILNHRSIFSGIDVNRNFLPQAYHIHNYNNGIVKGTQLLNGDSVLAYGVAGVWLTDRKFEKFEDYNSGFRTGIDRRNIKNLIKTPQGELWCATQFGLYRHCDDRWKEIQLPDNTERLSDITFNADSTTIVILSRSNIFTLPLNNTNEIERHTISAPKNKKSQVSLFKTIWKLHSGELFGLTGRLIVDIIALIIVFLCITGIVIFGRFHAINRHGEKHLESKPKYISIFKWSFLWHTKIGYLTVALTILIAVTGMCLRPPLMIPLVMVRTSPMPGTTLNSDNYFHDKMRGIRWDKSTESWLLCTSEGFMHVNENFTGDASDIPSEQTPPVSPMGINVFEQNRNGEWLIGSFSGLYLWSQSTGSVTDYYSGEEYITNSRDSNRSGLMVSGYSRDLNHKEIVVFDYSTGAAELPPMNKILADQPISLWNVALELHVGRLYSPVLGALSNLFVFLSGSILTMILISGLNITSRKHKRSKQ